VYFGERVERPPDLKNLTSHLDKRKVFTLNENIRKTQRNEEISNKKQKRQELYDEKNRKEAENDENSAEKDTEDLDGNITEKLTGAQKRQNRSKLGNLFNFEHVLFFR
jgi:predicted Holliday junction resolvase-like endonuclease